jgi:hypothetical protein
MVKKTDTIFIALMGVEILLYQSRNFGMAQEIDSRTQDYSL